MARKIVVTKGDTLEVDVSVVDESGAAVSLSGATLTWTISTQPGAAAVLTKTIGDGITIVSEAGGTLTMELTTTNTNALSAREYFSAVRVTFASGEVKTVSREYITVQA